MEARFGCSKQAFGQLFSMLLAPLQNNKKHKTSNKNNKNNNHNNKNTITNNKNHKKIKQNKQTIKTTTNNK